MPVRALLEQLEQTAGGPVEIEVALAYLACDAVELDEDELRGARRRALLLLAAGGDPHRELEPEGRAVLAVAADLDEPACRERLGDALTALQPYTDGLDAVSAALAALRADPDLAWRRLAAALVAEELAGEG